MTAERAVARIDLGAVERNCRHLAAQLQDGAELCAVVKADGYGHGADGCAAAALEGGAARLAVATAREAEQIGRRFHHVPLLTMGALTGDELDVCLDAGSEVAVWRPGFLRQVAARAQAQGRAGQGAPEARLRHGQAGQRRSGWRSRRWRGPVTRTPTSSSPASGPISRPPTSRATTTSASSWRAFRLWPSG